ncbi:MAG: hypothetical protein GKR95_23785 [Gammaproteobacteria bacterium]|nr:hypothetical protein [Gammaproteobacteria bacterium]NKB64999.1 hypothetical protein [Gammaproteobacteria bacterium]
MRKIKPEHKNISDGYWLSTAAQEAILSPEPKHEYEYLPPDTLRLHRLIITFLYIPFGNGRRVF